ncbi:hypothetical protein [Microbulbifer sp. GL-2]|uniref:hypothetical protein n=1 Tax=Microbulbifer sp. GL-2 TaxID=2591606 RepID=UPI001165A64D|nr:hypothetical protein [Microbulbifer sp. GL-2]BBM00437.1 hypothetical protein GL2_05110 [Microbulbifer sp. GL-2]
MLKRFLLVMLVPLSVAAEVPSDYDVVSAYQIEKETCKPTVYYVKNKISGIVRAIELENPCKIVDFSKEGGDTTPLNWSSYNTGQISKQSSLTKQSLTDWKILSENGDCFSTSYRLSNAKTQEVVTTTVEDTCKKIDFYHNKEIKHDYVVSSQVARIIGKDTEMGCDIVVSDSSALVEAINTASPDNNGYQICLQPGAYKAFKIEGKQNISFAAVNGMASIVGDLPLIDSNTQSGAVEILDSKNIDFFNINIQNLHVYRIHPEDPSATGTAHQVSRALNIRDSQNIGFYYSNIESEGKQTVRTLNSSVILKNTSISCYYFCVDGSYSNVDILDARINTLNKVFPGDTHSIFWTNYSDFNIINLNVNALSGKGLFAGIANPDRNKIMISGDTVIKGDLYGWVINHFNYYGIEVVLSGTEGESYPVIADFYNDTYRSGGPSYGSRVIKN